MLPRPGEPFRSPVISQLATPGEDGMSPYSRSLGLLPGSETGLSQTTTATTSLWTDGPPPIEDSTSGPKLVRLSKLDGDTPHTSARKSRGQSSRPSVVRKKCSARILSLCKSFLCSIRFLLVVFFGGSLLLNSVSLIVIHHVLASANIDKLKGLSDSYLHKSVRGISSGYFDRAETLLHAVGQYVRGEGVSVTPDWMGRDDVMQPFGGFLAGLQHAVIAREDPSLFYSPGFVSLRGDVAHIPPKGLFGASVPDLTMFYHNVSEDANNTFGGWSPAYYWPFEGTSSLHDGVSYRLREKTTRGIVAPHFNAALMATFFSQTLESPVANDTVIWNPLLTLVKKFTETASLRVYANSTSLIGVAFVIAQVSQSAWLQEHFTQENGIVFLMDPQGKLFGSNGDAADVFSYSETGVETPYQATDSPNAVIRVAALAIQNGFVTNATARVVTCPGGGRYIVGMRSFSASTQALVAVTAIPYAFVYAKIELGMALSIGVSILVSILGIMFAFLFVVLVTSPLRGLAVEMLKVEGMDLDTITVTRSLLTEVGMMQKAFMFTIERLREYRAYLPMDLFTVVEESASDVSSSMTSSTTTATHSATNKSLCDTLGGRFGLHIVRENRVVVFLHLFQLTGCSLASTEEGFILQYVKCLFDSVFSLARKFNGISNAYDMDWFLMTFTTTPSAASFALHLRDRLEAFKTALALPFVIGIHHCQCLVGNVGSSEVRVKVVRGREVELFRQLVTREGNGMQPGDSRILVTSPIDDSLPDDFHRFPRDIVQVKGQLFILYQVIQYVPPISEVWAGDALRSLSSEDPYALLREAFRSLNSGDVEEARAQYGRYVDGSSPKAARTTSVLTAQRMFRFCESLIEQKLNLREILQSPSFLSISEEADSADVYL